MPQCISQFSQDLETEKQWHSEVWSLGYSDRSGRLRYLVNIGCFPLRQHSKGHLSMAQSKNSDSPLK